MRRISWNISPIRGKTIISSLLVPLMRFRQACSIHTHSSILSSSELSSAVETNVIRPDDGEIVKNNEEKSMLEHPDYFEVHKLFTLKDLFNANVHLGHHEGCWDPLMKPYLYGVREKHHIIDLNQTVVHLRLALNVLSHITYKRGKILFVSTHPQYEELTQCTARECDEYFVTRRWRGGTLTNSYMLLGTIELVDLIVFLHLPSLGRNTRAVIEAAQLNIPTIGIVDSDCNPNLIMYPIPGNDDTPSAVQLYCDLFKKVILKAKEERRKLASDTEDEDVDSDGNA